jgi:hypothetical protein
MPGNFARQIEHFEHCRAFADNAVEVEIGKQFDFEVANLRALRGHVSEIVERLVKPRRVYWFAKVIAGAALDGFDGGVHRVMRGHQDDVNSRIELQGFLQKFHPVHSGHVQVRENHPAPAAMHDIERLRGIDATDGRKSRFLEALRSLLDKIGLVVEDTNREARAVRSCEWFFESRHGMY